MHQSIRALSPTAVLLISLSFLGCHQERNESIRLMNKGLQSAKQDKYTKALDFLDQSANADPTNHRAFYYSGQIFAQRLGDPKNAEKKLRQAISINGKNYEYHYHLGVALSDLKRWRDAVTALEQSIELKPDHGISHLRLGIALESIGQYDRAQKAYRDAVTHGGRMGEGYNLLGNLYRRFEKYSQAAHVLKNGIDNVPKFANNYHDLGLVYRAQERYDSAIEQFSKALKLKP